MITVFTPTYNRKKLLSRLYESLCQQSSYGFEWLIVDDCSTDDTCSYIKSLKKSPFPIRYYSTFRNSGKHVAYNVAIQQAKGEYFICIDSDDYVSSNAIAIIENSISSNANNIIGFIYPQTGNIALNNNGWRKVNGTPLDIIDMKELYHIYETTIVIRTLILKKHRFPQMGEEMYCPETVLYNELICDGKFIAIDREFYISEYQRNGLTNRIFKIWINSAQSVLYDLDIRYSVFKKYKLVQRIRSRIKCIMNINALCLKKHISIVNNTPSILYSFLMLIPSIIFSHKRFI